MKLTEQQRQVLMAALSFYGSHKVLPDDELMMVANLLRDLGLMINQTELVK